MKRRALLVTIGTTAAAGCLVRGTDGGGSDEHGEPEVRDQEPDNRDVTAWHEHGEWREFRKFALVVDGVELVDSVTLAGYGQEHEHTFDQERLAIVDYRLKAIEPDLAEYIPTGIDLELDVDGDRRELGISDDVFSDVEACETDSVCWDLTAADLTVRDGRRGHWGMRFEPGELRELWDCATVPAGTVASDVAIVVDVVGWES